MIVWWCVKYEVLNLHWYIYYLFSNVSPLGFECKAFEGPSSLKIKGRGKCEAGNPLTEGRGGVGGISFIYLFF